MRSKVLSKMRNCQAEGAGGADWFSTQQSQAALKLRELKGTQTGAQDSAELGPERLLFILLSRRKCEFHWKKGKEIKKGRERTVAHTDTGPQKYCRHLCSADFRENIVFKQGSVTLWIFT